MADKKFNPETRFFKERLRQAKWAFNLSLIATALSFTVTLAGVGLLLSEQVSKATVTTTGGLLSNVAFVKLATNANDRLDQASRALIEQDEKDHS